MNNSMESNNSLGLWDAVSIGVGGMVGGGIFAVLGLAVQMARGGTPVAFGLAGLVALITSYSYAKLSLRYPNQGGTVEFLNQAFGGGLLAKGLNILLLLSYIIMLSLYSYAFGSYGSAYLPAEFHFLGKHILISMVIILFTGLNIFSSKIIGESERIIVFLKITILMVFIIAGIGGIKTEHMQLSNWPGFLSLVAGGMIIFVAYEGFELIANTAQEIKNPQKNIPLAYYISVGFVIILYVVISLVTLGTLSFSQIASAEDYALAAAAEPLLGSFGFILITIAALLSTASAINATLYGACRISYILAKEGELPKIMEGKFFNRPVEGLFIISGLTLLAANLFDLSSISIMGSSGFLIIFLAVNASNVLLYKETCSSRSLSALGAIVCLLALVALIWQSLKTSPNDIWILVVIIIVSFFFQTIYENFGRNKKTPFLS